MNQALAETEGYLALLPKHSPPNKHSENDRFRPSSSPAGGVPDSETAGHRAETQ